MLYLIRGVTMNNGNTRISDWEGSSLTRAVRIRNYRRTHTRNQAREKFGISLSTITKICSYTDEEIVSRYGGIYPFVGLSLIDVCHGYQDRILVGVNTGVFKGLTLSISEYAILNTKLVPTFETLSPSSKIKFIRSALHDFGYDNIRVSVVGNNTGIGAEYLAMADGVRLHWESLGKIVSDYETILVEREGK